MDTACLLACLPRAFQTITLDDCHLRPKSITGTWTGVLTAGKSVLKTLFEPIRKSAWRRNGQSSTVPSWKRSSWPELTPKTWEQTDWLLCWNADRLYKVQELSWIAHDIRCWPDILLCHPPRQLWTGWHARAQTPPEALSGTVDISQISLSSPTCRQALQRFRVSIPANLKVAM